MSSWQIKLIWFWRDTVVPESKGIFWIVLWLYIISEIFR